MKQPYALLLVLMIIATAGAAAEEIRPAEVARRTVGNDLTVRQAELRLQAAYRGYRSARSGAGPSLTLKGPGGSANVYSFGLDTVGGLSSQSFGLELGYSQSLPAGSSLGASVFTTTTAGSGDSGTSFTQSPGASISYRIPLFVNGKLIEPRLTGSAYRGKELAYRRAEDQAVDGRNQAVLDALGIYVQVIDLRNTIDVLEEEIDLEREKLRELEITQQQGRTALADVWAAEINLQAKEDSLFEKTQTLRIRQRELLAKIGREQKNESFADELSPELPTITFEESAIRAAALEHQLAGPRIGVQSAELGAIVSLRQFGTDLGVSLSVSPNYPDEFSGGTFGESVSEFSGEGLSISGAVSFRLPIYRSGKKHHEAEIGRIHIEQARVTLDQRESDVQGTLDQQLLSIQLANERLDYLERSIELDQRRLEEAEQLFEFQTATEADVKTAAVQLHKRRNEAWKARADLMLTRLRLLSLAGIDIVEVLEEG